MSFATVMSHAGTQESVQEQEAPHVRKTMVKYLAQEKF
jgi:hypothetical protein